jgi:tight adherence protein C
LKDGLWSWALRLSGRDLGQKSEGQRPKTKDEYTMLLVITISTFICITFGVMAIYWLLHRPESAATERLRKLGQASTAGSASLAVEERPVAEIAEKFAAPINKLLPVSASEARKLQKQLMQAGYRSPDAPMIFRAMHLSAMIGFPALVAFGCALWAKPITGALIWILIGFVVGFFLPRYFLHRMIRARQLRVRWGLADALDLMVVCVEAGLGLNAAMLRVSDELREVHREVAEEFELANLEIRVGRDRDEALRNLAERTGVDDLRSLVAMLIQTDRFGTSIAKAVRAFSDSLRTKRRQRAEQAAQKAAVKLLFPLACFLFPTLFIAILGPAALTLIDTLAKL